MMRFAPLLSVQQPFELAFDFIGGRGSFSNQTDAIGHTEHVRIDSKGGHIECNARDHLGSFSSYSRQPHEIVNRCRDDSFEFVHQQISGPNQMF